MDLVNTILNFTFPETLQERDVFFANMYIFLNIYVRLYEIDKPYHNVTDELAKIERYIMERDVFKTNKTNKNEVYILVASCIEADMKDDGFLKSLDHCLTRNIQRIQRSTNYSEPVPIVSNLLDKISPLLDLYF